MDVEDSPTFHHSNKSKTYFPRIRNECESSTYNITMDINNVGQMQ
jgi:hypothetical protein